MKNQGLTQDDLKVAFRKDELERRDRRRARLRGDLDNVLARMKNEGTLLDELLTPDEMLVHFRAVMQIKQQEAAYYKEFHSGYWKRLFRALLNL